MLRYPTYMAVETLTIALITEDGQSFEDLGIEERKEGQVIIKCRAAEPMRDGAPCEWNKMGSDGYPFCASSTEVMRLREQNAKLREELVDAPKCEACEAMLDCDECLRADGSHKERRRLSIENAKLRELVRALYYCTTSGECDECPVNGGGAVHLMPDTICDTMHASMRELGIEWSDAS